MVRSFGFRTEITILKKNCVWYIVLVSRLKFYYYYIIIIIFFFFPLFPPPPTYPPPSLSFYFSPTRHQTYPPSPISVFFFFPLWSVLVHSQGTIPRAPLRRRFIPARYARRSAQPPSHLRASHRPAIPQDRALKSGPSGRGVYTGEGVKLWFCWFLLILLVHLGMILLIFTPVRGWSYEDRWGFWPRLMMRDNLGEEAVPVMAERRERGREAVEERERKREKWIWWGQQR